MGVCLAVAQQASCSAFCWAAACRDDVAASPPRPRGSAARAVSPRRPRAWQGGRAWGTGGRPWPLPEPPLAPTGGWSCRPLPVARWGGEGGAGAVPTAGGPRLRAGACRAPAGRRAGGAGGCRRGRRGGGGRRRRHHPRRGERHAARGRTNPTAARVGAGLGR